MVGGKGSGKWLDKENNTHHFEVWGISRRSPENEALQERAYINSISGDRGELSLEGLLFCNCMAARNSTRKPIALSVGQSERKAVGFLVLWLPRIEAPSWQQSPLQIKKSKNNVF